MMWFVRWRGRSVGGDGWDGFGVLFCFLAGFLSLFFDLSEQGLNERGGICHGRVRARRRVMVDDASLAW
jgi:hypothetical protein